MYKITIIVPRDLDGHEEPIKDFAHNEVFTYIANLFGGCTVTDCLGYWINPNNNRNKLFKENNYKIEIAVKDEAQHPKHVVKALIQMIHDVYLQAEYYTEIDGVPEFIKIE